MNEQKGFFTEFGNLLDRRLARLKTSTPGGSRLRRILRLWMPNPGTLVLVLALLFAVPALARNAAAPAASSVTTIPYQGRLADINGNPVTDRVNMEFRLYDVPSGGTPLWEEFWTGGNAVNVSDGLFSVMLGSIDTNLAQTVQGHDTLYLGITVGTDSEMSPRVQLGSVPFSVWSLTVADGSITAEKIASGAVGSDAIADGSVTPEKAPNLLETRPQNSIIQYGDAYATATENTKVLDLDITFPTAFGGRPRIAVTPHWNNTTYLTIVIYPALCDENHCKVHIERRDAGSWSAGNQQGVDWIAIGPKP